MNLKSVSTQVSQAILAITLGLVIYPQSAKAATSDNVTTNNLELSKPTLLVNNVQQVSMLVEASNTITTELINNVSSSTVDNVEKNTYTIAQEYRVKELETNKNTTEAPELTVIETNNLPPQNPVNSSTSPSLIASNENYSSTVNQQTSLSIPVEIPSTSPTISNTSSESISIPVEVENNTEIKTQSVKENSIAINIPVIPPVNEEESMGQQTRKDSEENTINVQQPTLITDSKSFANQNFVRRQNRIINPSVNENQQTSKENIISSVPIQIEYYNPMITPSSGQMVSPDLPEINSPERFLPENNRPINGYIWPAKGVFTSGYGWRWGRMHKGIDIAAPVGTPIVSASDGEVISAGWNSGGFGNLVKIRHFDGTVTLYAHNSRIHVRRGDIVKQGQHISDMGSTGFSTGPHLHFEIHPNGQKAVNPMAFLPRNKN